MQIKNTLSLSLENFTKCHLVIDSDCPLGELFDFSSSLSAFVVERINQSQIIKEKTDEEV